VEREADLDSVKKEFQAISDQAKIDASFDPVGMVRDDVTKAVAASTNPAEAAASASGAVDPAKAEGSTSKTSQADIGESKISLTGPEPAAAVASADKQAEAESPVAPRSAAE
jgi:hypothetical protein